MSVSEFRVVRGKLLMDVSKRLESGTRGGVRPPCVVIGKRLKS